MRENRKKTIRISLLILILLLGIGYAALTAKLKVDGTVHIDKTTWDVHFENVQVTEGSVEANPAPTTNNVDTTSMTYTINFTKPGDFYEFTVDVVNDGTIDAMVNTVSNKTYTSNGTTETELPPYLTNTVTYNDGTPINKNQELLHGTSEKIKVRVEFKKDIQASDLPSSGDTTVVFKFVGNFKQADENSIPVRNVCSDNRNITTLSGTTCSANENVTAPQGTICKRAINLHQEECTRTVAEYPTNYCSWAGYATGSTITYGSCGTSGTLTSGDAFTCDINGDGTFDELTERFYYISDYYDTTNKSFDTTTATLVYYNNVTEGISCNKNTYAYYSTYNENWHGPDNNLKSQLPTTSQWRNVSLKNTSRAILAEYTSTHDSPTTPGRTLPTAYSYEEYTARLLTAKEVMTGCNIAELNNNISRGELASCEYLMENTNYATTSFGVEGHYLETPSAYNSLEVWHITGSLYIGRNGVTHSTSYGVRPVIEVSKSNIVY